MKRSQCVIVFLLLVSSSCEFRDMQVNSYAKEMCSCLFITKQPEAYCHDLARHILHRIRLSPLKTQIDHEYFTVQVKIGDTIGVAKRNKNQKLGCSLIREKSQ